MTGGHMSRLRIVFVALAAMLSLSSPARADEGTVTIQFYKAGWVIGGSFGKGVLSFRGQMYGLTFGGSQTSLQGRVRNIRQASDIEGVYGAGSAGAAIIRGAQAIVLTNQKGA